MLHGRPYHSEALEMAQRGGKLLDTVRDDHTQPYFRHVLTRVYVLTGERDKAVDLLDKLLARPYWLTRAWIRIDPTFDSLRGHPRFEQLVMAK